MHAPRMARVRCRIHPRRAGAVGGIPSLQPRSVTRCCFCSSTPFAHGLWRVGIGAMEPRGASRRST
eukprot:3297268-Lingulodinium_polyedra.AAC.1